MFALATTGVDESHKIIQSDTMKNFLYSDRRESPKGSLTREDWSMNRALGFTPLATGSLILIIGTQFKRTLANMKLYYVWFRCKWWSVGVRKTDYSELKYINERDKRFNIERLEEISAKASTVWKALDNVKSDDDRAGVAEKYKADMEKIREILADISIRRSRDTIWCDGKPLCPGEKPEIIYPKVEPINLKITKRINMLLSNRINELFKEQIDQYHDRLRQAEGHDKSQIRKEMFERHCHNRSNVNITIGRTRRNQIQTKI
jgi:hypothetical protein